MKLSKLQEKVIKLMQEGWELGSYSSFGYSVSLQKGGLGKGGECFYPNLHTFWSLMAKGLIEEVPNQEMFASPKRYQLTQKGKDWK